MENLSLDAALVWRVFYGGEVSRGSLAKEFGVSLATVSRVADRLRRSGLIQESPVRVSPRGRPQAVLQVNRNLGLVLGIELDRDRVSAAVADMAGALLGYASVAHDLRQSYQTALWVTERVVREALAQASLDLSRICRVGVGHTGVLDYASGVVVSWDGSRQWLGVPLAEDLERRLGRPVTLDDRARAIALAQLRQHPEYAAFRDILHVHVGTGIGAAFFHDQRLMRGATWAAGELGHLVVHPEGPRCRCGNRGCVEAFASIEAIIARARQAWATHPVSLLHRLAPEPGQIQLETVITAARLGDSVTLEILNTAAEALGTGIANAVKLLNPSLIVISGRLLHLAGQFLAGPVRERIRHSCFEPEARKMAIRFADFRLELGAVGCGLLAVEAELAHRLRRPPARSPEAACRARLWAEA